MRDRIGGAGADVDGATITIARADIGIGRFCRRSGGHSTDG
ncbi:MAG: hypothetical protein AAGK78_05330 [Planctomycetota bacterium]